MLLKRGGGGGSFNCVLATDLPIDKYVVGCIVIEILKCVESKCFRLVSVLC